MSCAVLLLTRLLLADVVQFFLAGAGYQTALYHAAVGVAKFASSAEPADA